MSAQGSVTLWIEQLKAGDDAAAQRLWERYYHRLIALARNMLGQSPRRISDEEDVVQDAFKSFCLRAREGLFPKLKDRDDLWGLLVVITARKVANQRTFELRAKRGGGQVRGDSGLGSWGSDDGFAQIVGNEPTPEFALLVAEELERLLDALEDATHQAIALWKLEGWTNKEIAQQLDCSLSAVERKLRLIRRRLESLDDAASEEE